MTAVTHLTTQCPHCRLTIPHRVVVVAGKPMLHCPCQTRRDLLPSEAIALWEHASTTATQFEKAFWGKHNEEVAS